MFAAIRITHYKQLSVDVDFDQLKRLLKDLGDILSHELEPYFGKVSASRIYPDTFGVLIKSEILKDWDAFWNHLQHRLCNTWTDSESEAGRIAVHGGLIFKSKDYRGKESDLLAQMDRLLKDGKAGTYRFEEFDQAATDHSPVMSRMDMLEFIAFDWEARAKELEDNLRGLMETNAELDRLNWGTLNALARAIDAKSPWTAGHSGRVTQLALTIGRALKLDDDELADLHRAALLHDIGKIAIPAEILDKPGRLTKDEYDIICEHPKRGARILEPIEAYAGIIPIVRQHHERFDGNGYPDRLSGTGITKCARILAVADVYDALTSERPYRAGMSHNRAIDIITEGKGTQFDAEVVDTFLRSTADKDRPLPACPAHQGPETSPLKRPCTGLSHSPTLCPR
jgi:putative nucleotidyltransferase with HDIG domain